VVGVRDTACSDCLGESLGTFADELVVGDVVMLNTGESLGSGVRQRRETSWSVGVTMLNGLKRSQQTESDM